MYVFFSLLPLVGE